MALKQSIPWLQQIFQEYYITNPKDFIYFLELIDEYSLHKVKAVTQDLIKNGLPVTTSHIKSQILNTETVSEKVLRMPSREDIDVLCQDQLSEISMLYHQGGSQ